VRLFFQTRRFPSGNGAFFHERRLNLASAPKTSVEISGAFQQNHKNSCPWIADTFWRVFRTATQMFSSHGQMLWSNALSGAVSHGDAKIFLCIIYLANPGKNT
jgi:hypothetical protein